jgi:hypothetical protein
MRARRMELPMSDVRPTTASGGGTKTTRRAVTQREAIAAARARIAADKLRGVPTDIRIVRLSERNVS